jgi:hydrogenase expression/formation protein HypD
MKYLNEFRDPALARKLVEHIRRTASRPWVIMEVCGGQTHGLLRHGIDEALEGAVELIHGPGCPVCVTPAEAIDFACRLAQLPATTVTSFGDMLRVPGSRGALSQARANGGDVRIVYSPLDAVTFVRQNPNTNVVFFAVGFETTMPATALAVLQARDLGLENFSLLTAHVRVLPAMRGILSASDNRVQAFLAAGHVCTVTGYRDYEQLATRYQVPIAVTGFEPVDLLEGILDCVTQLEAGLHTVTNRYERSVRVHGNSEALRFVERVYQVADRPWRGLGVIPGGGFVLRDEFHSFDAERRFSAALSQLPVLNETRCRSGDVLSGRIKPRDCSEFGRGCTPASPLGAPMVSSEGACAAYYRYAALPGLVACPTLSEAQ